MDKGRVSWLVHSSYRSALTQQYWFERYRRCTVSSTDSTVVKFRRWCPISQAREVEAKKPKKGSEIPIPTVRVVPTYDRDYLPLFKEQNTYIRGRGNSALHASTWKAFS